MLKLKLRLLGSASPDLLTVSLSLFLSHTLSFFFVTVSLDLDTPCAAFSRRTVEICRPGTSREILSTATIADPCKRLVSSRWKQNEYNK